jgi:hypothetical protein
LDTYGINHQMCTIAIAGIEYRTHDVLFVADQYIIGAHLFGKLAADCHHGESRPR